MTAWLIAGGLAALGIGGITTAALTGFLPLAGILGGLSLGKVLDFIRSPVGIAVMWGLSLLGAAAYTGHKVASHERAICQARIDASIEAARVFDAEVAAEQHAAAAQQIKEAQARVAGALKEVDEYARTHPSCSIGAAGADMLGSLSGDEPVQPSVPLPPSRSGRGAR